MKTSRLNYYAIVVLLFISTTFLGQSQRQYVPKELNNSSWEHFKTQTELLFNVDYYLQPDSLPDLKIEVLNDTLTLEEVLIASFKSIGFSIATDNSGSYFITLSPIRTRLPLGFFSNQTNISDIEEQVSERKENNGELVTSRVYVAKTVVIGSENQNPRKNKCKLTGRVTGGEGEPIIGGTIYVDELETGAVTDENGNYELSLSPGKYTLVFNSIESIERNVKIELVSSGTLDVKLDQNLYVLQEVEIKSAQEHNVKGIQMGYEKISSKMIKEIPVVLGEKDVIKIALLLPGVTSVGEGASGFNVRGSPSDQNLFIIENTPVYNTSHLFGFFSAFNPDIIDNFTLYKGSIPAKFGGRLSSIFDISTKSGNMEKFSARGGISPITARLMVEGPIAKNKVSYIAGVRSTYSDWVLKLVKDPEVRDSRAYFGDAVLGFDLKLNESNNLKLFGYYSEDRIKLVNSTKYNFQNQGASINWFHGFKNKHDLNLSFVYSDYAFEEENSEVEFAAYKQNYRIQHSQFNVDMDLVPFENHKINAGFSGVLYMLDRGQHLPLNELSGVAPINFGKEQAIESALYFSDEWKISELITLYGGLRYNLYTYLGPQEVFKYKANSPLSTTTIIDTLNFNDYEPIVTYGGLDYRVSANFLLNPNLSIKAAYNRLHQYIFMLTNTIAVSPSDKWKLADYNIKPMVGDQFSVGLYANFGSNFEGSIEGYYKKANNIVEYKDGADLITSKYVERDILQGELDSWGVELMLKKPFGRLNGWVNYSYSNSTVLVNDKATGENINFGERYNSNFDRPHTFNLVANFKASRRLILSGNLIYSSGRPITYPAAIYYLDGQKILHYSQRNEYRIPDYFRIDLALKLEGNLVSKKLAHGVFILSVYNLTGRKNAYSVYFKSEYGKVSGYKMSIFGTPIFSLTYDFKLGNYND